MGRFRRRFGGGGGGQMDWMNADADGFGELMTDGKPSEKSGKKE
jgi:hypothetical protein